MASITAGINTNTNGENTTVSLLLSGVLNQGPFIAYGGLKGILLPISTDPIIEASAGGSSSSNVDE